MTISQEIRLVYISDYRPFRPAWAQYPAVSQVKFDGAAVLLEEYATAPLSAVMGESPYPPPSSRQATAR